MESLVETINPDFEFRDVDVNSNVSSMELNRVPPDRLKTSEPGDTLVSTRLFAKVRMYNLNKGGIYFQICSIKIDNIGDRITKCTIRYFLLVEL